MKIFLAKAWFTLLTIAAGYLLVRFLCFFINTLREDVIYRNFFFVILSFIVILIISDWAHDALKENE